MESQQCENCGSVAWVCDPCRGETLCVDCGLVYPERVIDEHEERITRMDAKNYERTQMMDTYFESLAKTKVVSAKKSKSSVVTAHQRLEARGSLQERQLDTYFADIRDLCVMFDFSKAVSDLAKSLVVAFQKHKDGERAVDSKSLAVCVLLIASSKLSSGVTLRIMLGYATDVNEEAVRQVRKKLLMYVPEAHVATRTGDIITYQCTLLDLDMAVESVAVAVLQKCDALVEGKTPSSVAGTCILLACGLLGRVIDKADVASASQVVVGTLDNLCRLIRKSHNPVLTPAELRKIHEYGR